MQWVWALAIVGALLHPGGLPGLLEITAEGRTVVVDWSAPPDDVAVIVQQAGDAPHDIASYVLEHVAVDQAGHDCPGDAAARDRLEDGARLTFTCPSEVGTVTVTSTILLEVDPSYQTLAVAPVVEGPERVLFSGGTTQRRLVLSDAPDPPAAPDVPRTGLEPAYGFEQRLFGLVDRSPGPLGLTAIVVGMAVGAAHALAPGHGKTIAAAYLVAGEGGGRDAVLLGAAVAGMHTVSVLAIGLAVYATTRTVATARLLPWLGVASGLAVVALGAWMTARRLRGHDHDHDHVHLPPPTLHPVSKEGLAIVASSGGLLPSPTALAVLLAAIAVGRTALGLVVVVAFSVGLAGAIALLGTGVIWGRDALLGRAEDHPVIARLAGVAPLVGAIAVLGAGIVVTVRAVLAL